MATVPKVKLTATPNNKADAVAERHSCIPDLVNGGGMFPLAQRGERRSHSWPGRNLQPAAGSGREGRGRRDL